MTDTVAAESAARSIPCSSSVHRWIGSMDLLMVGYIETVVEVIAKLRRFEMRVAFLVATRFAAKSKEIIVGGAVFGDHPQIMTVSVLFRPS